MEVNMSPILYIIIHKLLQIYIIVVITLLVNTAFYILISEVKISVILGIKLP